MSLSVKWRQAGPSNDHQTEPYHFKPTSFSSETSKNVLLSANVNWAKNANDAHWRIAFLSVLYGYILNDLHLLDVSAESTIYFTTRKYSVPFIK